MRLYCEQYDYYLYIICKEMVYNVRPQKRRLYAPPQKSDISWFPSLVRQLSGFKSFFCGAFAIFLLSCCRNLESAVETVMVVKRSLRLLSDLNWLWMAETQALLFHSQQRPGITKMWNLDGLSSLMKKTNKRSRFSAEC